MRVLMLIGIIVFSSQFAIADHLLIVGDDNAKPKNWLNEDGKAEGVMIDLLNEVSRRTGITFDYQLMPWKRALKLSSLGRGSIIGFSKTSERQKTWHYSVPMYFDELVFVTTKDKVFDFNGLSSLAGRTVAIKLGASYGDDFEQARKNRVYSVVETTDRKGQLQMLSYGRVDLVLMSPGRLALESTLAENKFLIEHRNDYVLLDKPFKLDPNYLGMPKSINKKSLLLKIDSALESIKSEPIYQKIIERNIDKVLASLNK